MAEYFHSVTLDKSKCKGCTTCIKHCPTEAIRVRNGKATIIPERCIDCGACIRSCPHRAKRAVCTPLSVLKDKKYNIALPAPSLYGQFHNLDDISYILSGLKRLGFDMVYEVASAAEVLSALTRKYMQEHAGDIVYPVISSACPACVRLIQKRFPNLIENVVPFGAPVELAAQLAKEKAIAETGLLPEDIGVYFITPCPAKMTSAVAPVGFKKPVMDGAFAIDEIYKPLLAAMNGIDIPDVQPSSGLIGIGWSVTGGESSALLDDSYLAVDGIDNVIKILSDIEDDKLPDVKFIELNACTQGCVGGCLTTENAYVAKTRVRRLMKYLPVSRYKRIMRDDMQQMIEWDKELESTPVGMLDEDITSAFQKMQDMNKLLEDLPGLDCGSCGAPSCRSLAEDIVLGFASEDDCIFRMRERVQYMTGSMDADEYLPPPFRKAKDSGSKD